MRRSLQNTQIGKSNAHISKSNILEPSSKLIVLFFDNLLHADVHHNMELHHMKKYDLFQNKFSYRNCQ